MAIRNINNNDIVQFNNSRSLLMLTHYTLLLDNNASYEYKKIAYVH